MYNYRVHDTSRRSGYKNNTSIRHKNNYKQHIDIIALFINERLRCLYHAERSIAAAYCKAD